MKGRADWTVCERQAAVGAVAAQGADDDDVKGRRALFLFWNLR